MAVGIENQGSPKYGYRPDIDGLRAIAVLAVLVFHAFPDSFRGGFIGVDIFFVISGYLISSIIFEDLKHNTFRFSDFYARRIRRIFPSLVIVLLASLIFGALFLFPEDFNNLTKHAAAAAAFVANYIFLGEAGYFDVSADAKPLLHLWSLSIEEQFYLLWPALIVLLWRSQRALAGFMILAVVASFYLNIASLELDPSASFYLTQPRVWELLFGALLAFSKFHGIASRWSLSNAFTATGLGLFAFGFMKITPESPFPGYWALVPALGTLLIIAADKDAWINRVVLSNPLLVRIGLISYPLYLWHWPLLSFSRILRDTPPSPLFTWSLVLASGVLAELSYRFVETPLRLGRISPRKVSSLAALSVAIFLTSLFLYKSNYSNKSIQVRGTDSALRSFDSLLNEERNGRNNLSKSRLVAIRNSICHLAQRGQSFEEFKQGVGPCLAIDPKKTNVLVIGDSYAADTYVALCCPRTPDSKAGDFVRYVC